MGMAARTLAWRLIFPRSKDATTTWCLFAYQLWPDVNMVSMKRMEPCQSKMTVAQLTMYSSRDSLSMKLQIVEYGKFYYEGENAYRLRGHLVSTVHRPPDESNNEQW